MRAGLHGAGGLASGTALCCQRGDDPDALRRRGRWQVLDNVALGQARVFTLAPLLETAPNSEVLVPGGGGGGRASPSFFLY